MLSVAASLYVAAESTSVRVNDVIRVAYATGCAMIAVALLITIATRAPRYPRAAPLVWGFAVFVIAWALPVLYMPDRSVTYVAGDAVTLLVPVATGVIVARQPGLRTQSLASGLLLVTMVVSAIASQWYFTQVFDIVRHRPPQLVLIAAAWVWALASGSMRRGLGIGLVVLTAVLATRSGFRWPLVEWAVAGSLLVLLRFGWRRAVLAALPLTIVAVVAGVAGTAASVIAETPAGSRFERIASGDLDPSSEGRINEAADVVRHMERWPGIAWVTGGGHGVEYEVRSAGFAQGLTDFHSVHIGPIRMLFRYGLVGLAMTLAAVVLVVAYLREVRRRGLEAVGAFTAITAVSAALVLLDFLMFNPLTNLLNGGVVGMACADFARLYRERRGTTSLEASRRTAERRVGTRTAACLDA